MIWKKTLSSLIFFLVLVLLYSGDRWWTERRRTAKEMSERAFPFPQADVNEITLVTPKEIITVKKEKGDRWEMTQPVQTGADKDAIEVILGNLILAVRYGEFKMDETIKVEDYGLDAPTYKLMLKTKSVPQGMTLLVGKQAPESGKFYAKIESEPKIFSINEYIKDKLDKKPLDLRDRTVLPVTVENVRQVVLSQEIKKIFEIQSVEGGTTRTTTGTQTKPSEKIVLVRNDGGWQLEQPVKWKGDSTEIENFLRKLKTEKVTAFVDKPTTQPVGFDKPQIDLLVKETSTTTGTTQPVTLSLVVGDRETSPSRDFYARRGDGSIVKIGQPLFDSLAITPGKLRDKQLFTLEAANVGRFDIETLRSKVQLKKNDQGRWVFAADAATSVDQQGVGDTISSLVNLRAKGFETDDATSFREYKLDKPYVRLTIADKGSSRIESLAIGELATRNNEGVVFARVGDSKAVVLLDFTKPSEFALTKDKLTDKSLFAFDPKAVSKAEVRRGSTSFTLTREGEAWRILRPKAKEAQRVSDFSVDDLTRAVRELKYTELYKGKLTEKEMGLTSPTLDVVFYGAGGSEIARVIRGLEKGGRYYTKLHLAGPVYGVEAPQFKGLDPAVDNLLKEK